MEFHGILWDGESLPRHGPEFRAWNSGAGMGSWNFILEKLGRSSEMSFPKNLRFLGKVNNSRRIGPNSQGGKSSGFSEGLGSSGWDWFGMRGSKPAGIPGIAAGILPRDWERWAALGRGFGRFGIWDFWDLEFGIREIWGLGFEIFGVWDLGFGRFGG